MQRRTLRRHLACLSTLVLGSAALALTPGLASAATQAPADHTLAASTRFYVPPPAQGSVQQILQLVKSGQLKNAGLITAMEAVPSAVWLDGETAAQAAEPGNEGSAQADADVARQVRLTLAAARLENAVPIFVAYNIPGRDCSQYSAGGAPTDADYDAWINAIGGALGNAKAVVLEEPDSLADLPGYCGAAYAAEFPDITNTTRVGDVAYAVSTLEADPNISLYLDAGNSAWQNVGGMAETLTAGGRPAVAGVLPQRLQLPVRREQRLLRHLGVGVHRLRDRERGPDPGRRAGGGGHVLGNLRPHRRLRRPGLSPTSPPGGCATQYWNGGAPGTNIASLAGAYTGVRAEPVRRLERDLHYRRPQHLRHRRELRQRPRQHGADHALHRRHEPQRPRPGQHAVLRGRARRPARQRHQQPAGGNWCNPPSAGLGLKPTANTGVSLSSLDSYLPGNPPLLDAYLWVKTPGQSDGQCDAAGGVRSWDDAADTPSIAGWPSASSASFQTFDPLWSLATNSLLTDPAAGAWFSQQALTLAQNASPALLP